MKVGFVGEGSLDSILIPPLLTTIAKKKAQVNWPIHIQHDIRKLFQLSSGFGEVVKAVRNLLSLLGTNPHLFRKQFDYVVVLLDGSGKAEEAYETINELINGHPEFILARAIREVEAWVLADREHLLEWLEIDQKRCPGCRFFDSGYSPEKDPDPKETLNQMIQASHKTGYDVWDEGAAEEFIQSFWRGTDLPDWQINMNLWPGRADLRLIAEKCPEGYAPFEKEIMRILGK